MNKYKISRLIPKEDYYRVDTVHNRILSSHRKEMIPYVWVQLDDNNIVKGKYCSSSLYDNRTFDKLNIGDKIDCELVDGSNYE